MEINRLHRVAENLEVTFFLYGGKLDFLSKILHFSYGPSFPESSESGWIGTWIQDISNVSISSRSHTHILSETLTRNELDLDIHKDLLGAKYP